MIETIFSLVLVIVCSIVMAIFGDTIELVHIEIMYDKKHITFDEYYELSMITYKNTSFGYLADKIDNLFFRRWM